MRHLLLCLSLLVPGPGSAAADGLDPAGKPQAPDFTLADLRGEPVRLSDLRGRVVLLNFWATWCMPCRDEMPSMQRLWQTYRDRGLTVLAVSTDTGGKKRVANFARRLELSFPILLDSDGQVSDRYQVSGVPASFLIDRQGRIVAHVLGSEDWASEAAFQQVERLLAEAAETTKQ